MKAKDIDRRTTLDLARKEGNTEIIKLLEQAEAKASKDTKSKSENKK